MINKRQYNILSFFLTRSLFLGGGLSLLVGLSKNDLLITGIVGMLLGYFILYLLFKKDRISKIVCIIIASMILVINTLANTVLTSTYLLYNTPTLLIVLMFFLVLLYASNKEFNVIGRVTTVFIVVSVIEILLAILGLVNLIEIDNMLPMFTTKYMDVIKGILVFCGASVLPNILLINYKGDLKYRDVCYGYVIGSMLMILVMFLIVSIYGSEFASITRFPEFLILKKIDLLGYFSNVENVLVTEWMFNILFSALVCMKVIKDNLSIKGFIGIVVLIIVGSEMFLNRSYVNVLLVKQYFYYVSFILVIFSLLMKKGKKV